MTVAALFVRADSVYKAMPGVDAWDMERDARRWPGGAPVVAHPPCRAWGVLRALAKPRPDEKELARWAVAQVRRFGGVLEHPDGSTLWPDQGLPAPGMIDEWGGRTIRVDQQRWGHRAEKMTRFYVVGLPYPELVDMLPPPPTARATHVVCQSRARKGGRRVCKGMAEWRPECSKAEREHTPPALAAWLVEVASRCKSR